ncbi:phosphatidylglycerophosphatase C [Paenibacillus sp. W4I10]|uniref:HAD family hydrolase n=1 Tax=Paenibacillus sp. W4I10 TaxID=3042298 RepID=UPI002786382F|nr:HAD family hydrolase [Paenibacillus sp. W4I10]MDQ0719052.1 phosphatidylglycerophosphatase C [Paenibacillus sp. W4I10]
MKSTKVAIFDIDKTIIRSDSMFQFVHYGVRRYPWQVWRLPVIALHTVLFKAGFMTVEQVKRSYFQEIERMSEKDLEHFFDTHLRTSIFAEASVEMQHRKEAGYHVLLVTASPHAYMKYFKNFPWVDHVIGTELVRHENGYTCRIDGSNCKGEEKVRRIQAYLSEKNMVIDYDQSCSYSDSLSDLPVMQLVSQRYFINKRVPDMEALTWGK